VLLWKPARTTRNIKAGDLAIRQLSETIAPRCRSHFGDHEPMGTMLAGQTVEAMWASLRHAHPLAFE